MNLDYYFPENTKQLGVIRILASDKGLCRVDFVPEANETVKPNQLTQAAHEQLHAYFTYTRQTFDLPLDVHGTPFQQEVWAALQTIPYGTTWHYAALSQQINRPKAQRAVGAANGKNPLSIIVPCHRVIGKNGQLTGYSGGLSIKNWLLQHEQNAPT